jgi:hypothetical protein
MKNKKRRAKPTTQRTPGLKANKPTWPTWGKIIPQIPFFVKSHLATET